MQQAVSLHFTGGSDRLVRRWTANSENIDLKIMAEVEEVTMRWWIQSEELTMSAKPWRIHLFPPSRDTRGLPHEGFPQLPPWRHSMTLRFEEQKLTEKQSKIQNNSPYKKHSENLLEGGRFMSYVLAINSVIHKQDQLRFWRIICWRCESPDLGLF